LVDVDAERADQEAAATATDMDPPKRFLLSASDIAGSMITPA
jgi:hypothetical protein